MLKRITVSNLALIDELEIEFSGNLNVFTGETGAGKSIIVDSLMLLIGARYDKSMLKYGKDKGYVEGVFECEPRVGGIVDTDDGLLIVTRRFYKDGKNEIRVNGKQITTAMLRELMSDYVDIYGQNEYQSLLKVTEQRKILDNYIFGRDGAPLDGQRRLYDEYKKLKSDMSSLGDEAERARRIDVLKFQINEIESAAVGADEEQKLLDRRHLLMSAERIKNALAECLGRLDADDGAASAVSNSVRALSAVSSLGDNYASLHERLRSASIELDDIAECLRDELDGMDTSERELDTVVARLDKLRALKAKYGAYEAMNKILSDAKAELDRAENGAEEYERLVKRETALKKSFTTVA